MKAPGCAIQAFLAIVTLLLSLVEPSHSSYCQIWKADIQRSDDSVKVSRDYKGLWLSDKCEIHPGPQFLLRRYQILKGGHFHLIRYHYLDPWCTSAAFSVTAVGSFTPPPEKATSSSTSWVVPGGIELDYTIRKVTLVPYTVNAAEDLSRKVNSSCPGAVLSKWRTYKKYKVLSYEAHSRSRKHHLKTGLMDDVDCTGSLGLFFNELQLMRLEHRMPLRFVTFRRHGEETKEVARRYHLHLFLGADGSRTGHRPTYYQVPLLPSQTTSCPVCRQLSQATATSPPELLNSHALQLPPDDLKGHWISLRCEVRPYGLFLKRAFVFNSKKREWLGRHEYYKDPRCKSSMFTLSAKGLFFPGQTSKVVSDAMEYDFQILESSITPEDQQFVYNLNGLPSCGSGSKWKIGHTVNLTKFGGCKDLGIIVPSTEFDLVRFESFNSGMVLLYLGDTTEDHKRPTSFQPPLAQCSHEEDANEDHNLLGNDLLPLPLISGSNGLSKSHSIALIIVYCIMVKILQWPK